MQRGVPGLHQVTVLRRVNRQPIRYGDLLLKVDGEWHFQTMVQGGWG